MERKIAAPREVTIQFGERIHKYKVETDPFPHIVVKSSKELHGWWPGKRECTSERLLINPYNGCSLNCFCCYAKALWGYFQLWREEGVVTVFKDFDKVIAEQLDSISLASCGYLSPVTDPFQPINEKYRLAEKIVKEFISRNIPIEFITKAKVSEEVIELIKEQKHSFGQVSLLTLDEGLYKVLCPGGGPIAELVDNIYRLSKNDIFAVCRIDPIIPYLTDGQRSFKNLIHKVVDKGAKHIIASIMDIPHSIRDDVMKTLKELSPGLAYDLGRLYTESIDNALNAQIDYRRKLFSYLRETCDKVGITFALCMEYKLVDGHPVGLNAEFMSSVNCEGIDIPIYIREGDRFKPITDCSGACLRCIEAKCGIPDLAMGKNKESKKDWKLADYKRWSKEIQQTKLL